MKFRPCIDIHNGKVKQIVGGSLTDALEEAKENFVSNQDAAYYAKLYQQHKIKGGHIILLNPSSSPYYEVNVKEAKKALQIFPGGLQIGGGITTKNAKEFIEAGASHVIVTSYAFYDGVIDYSRLEKLIHRIGKEHLVLDLSCRRKDGEYYIVTNRWQTFTKEKLSKELLDHLSKYCDEFLIHAVDVEGKTNGIEEDLVRHLGEWNIKGCTYAGGVSSYEDISRLKRFGKNQIDVTIGSALDLFGGPLSFEKVLTYINEDDSNIVKNRDLC